MKVKRNARLAAVQVIFQYYFSKTDINKIISDFSKLNEDCFSQKYNNDKKLFEKIVLGVYKNQNKIKLLNRRKFIRKLVL